MEKRRIPRYPTETDMVSFGGKLHSVMSTTTLTGCGIAIPNHLPLEKNLPFSAATCRECVKWLRTLNPRLK